MDPPETKTVVVPVKPKEEPRRSLQTVLIMSIVVVAAFIFLSVVSESESLSLRSSDIGSKTARIRDDDVVVDGIATPATAATTKKVVPPPPPSPTTTTTTAATKTTTAAPVKKTPKPTAVSTPQPTPEPTPQPTSDKALAKANGVCADVCTQRRTKRSELATTNSKSSSSSSSGNVPNHDELIERVEASKVRLLDKLKRDYGEYFEPIFVDGETGAYRPVRPLNEVSLDRLKRKLAIKILSVQSKQMDPLTRTTGDANSNSSNNNNNNGNDDSNFHGCDCGSDKAIRVDDVIKSLDPKDASVVLEGLGGGDDDDGDRDDGDDDGLWERYVWATGGHSAAAGHGNLYNETYTSYMEADLKDVFGSVGIDFEGRNYAMGGTDSATKVSMCWKEIFGTDVDFFSWDYGMTDGKDATKLLHYAYRGLLAPTRPATMILHHNGRSGAARINALDSLREMGAAAFLADESDQKTMRDNFPDSAGIDASAIDALPEYVRNYKCGTSIEKGDPFCQTDKYTKIGCAPRLKQVSWHPGFKDHAAVGHGLALFLMETLLDTLRDLSENDEAKDVPRLLLKLSQEDIDLHNDFRNAELPELHDKFLDLENIETGDNEATIDNALFFKGPSMCHTARLPSQTRYLGILTETDAVGGPAPVGEETYYVGHFKTDATRTQSDGPEMRIVYVNSKEREKHCDGYTVKPDYPDSWFAGSQDGWTSLTFPNPTEQDYYGYDPTRYQGIIVIHWKKCDWGKCPKGFVPAEDDEDYEMKINGQKVKEVIEIKHSGHIVKGMDTGFHFEPDSDGKYTIELKVKKDKHYIELADVVLY